MKMKYKRSKQLNCLICKKQAKELEIKIKHDKIIKVTLCDEHALELIQIGLLFFYEKYSAYLNQTLESNSLIIKKEDQNTTSTLYKILVLRP